MLKQATSLSPCVIVLDDLDVICPSSKGEQQNAQEDFLHYRYKSFHASSSDFCITPTKQIKFTPRRDPEDKGGTRRN